MGCSYSTPHDKWTFKIDPIIMISHLGEQINFPSQGVFKWMELNYDKHFNQYTLILAGGDELLNSPKMKLSVAATGTGGNSYQADSSDYLELLSYFTLDDENKLYAFKLPMDWVEFTRKFQDQDKKITLCAEANGKYNDVEKIKSDVIESIHKLTKFPTAIATPIHQEMWHEDLKKGEYKKEENIMEELKHLQVPDRMLFPVIEPSAPCDSNHMQPLLHLV